MTWDANGSPVDEGADRGDGYPQWAHGVPRAHRAMADLFDYGNQIAVAFEFGEGDTRRRLGVPLTKDAARALLADMARLVPKLPKDTP